MKNRIRTLTLAMTVGLSFTALACVQQPPVGTEARISLPCAPSECMWWQRNDYPGHPELGTIVNGPRPTYDAEHAADPAVHEIPPPV